MGMFMKPLAVSGFLVLGAVTSFSAILYVPTQYPTIQAGIDASSNGDTVLVAPGTYTGTDNTNIDYNGKNIVLMSEQGPELTIIDVEGNGRGFQFHSGESSESVVQGFTVTKGEAIPGLIDNPNPGINMGGAVYCLNSSPSFINCIFVENESIWESSWMPIGADMDRGSAVALIQSNSSFTNCSFVNNYSKGVYHDDTTYSGGTIACVESSPSFYNCTFFNNNTGLDDDNVVGTVFKYENFDDPIDSPTTFENCIIAFNNGVPVRFYPETDSIQFLCTNIYGNISGDWMGCIADQAGTNGNFSADPIFCDTAAGNYHLSLLSHCRAAYNSCGVLIGALDVGCTVEYVCGDADGDNDVTWDDVTYLWEFYYSYGPFPEPPDAGDPNCDGHIDISDLVHLAEYLNGSGQEPCCFEGFFKTTAVSERNQHR